MARKISAMRAEEKLGGFATAKKHITVQYNERERSVRQPAQPYKA